MEPMIQVEGLTRTYRKFVAVDHVSFHIAASQIFGLIGPNGAGKSTTIKMLTTLLPPTSGTAKINGFNLLREPAKVRATIGYVPQMISVDGDLTAYENLMLTGKLYGLPTKKLRQRIEEVLKFMGLTEHAHRLVNEYSGGMVRRLEIAQAVLHKPAVLFLDEPTMGLDPSARTALWQSIQEWRIWFGTTFLMTTHDMDEAEKLCDIIAFMHLGRLIALGPPQELKQHISPKATLDEVFLHYFSHCGCRSEKTQA